MSKADDGGGSTKAGNISKAKRERGDFMIPSEVAVVEVLLSHNAASPEEVRSSMLLLYKV